MPNTVVGGAVELEVEDGCTLIAELSTVEGALDKAFEEAEVSDEVSTTNW